MSNRTQRGLKNSIVALSYYIVSIILGFVSRKIFIDYLGADLLGLNTTAQNLLGFLNLAELGIGSAIAFTLYKPLSVNDKNQVAEIITVQGWLYRKIANFVFVAAIVLSCFFPFIFSDIHMSIWYAYGSFGVYLFSSLLTYYINYKQIVLSANQEEYKITYSYKCVLLLQSICQIIAIRCFSHPYIWWILIQVAFSVLAALSLNRVIRRDYPYLNSNIYKGKDLSKKYPIIIQKVKQLFVHKISGFVLTQTSPIIIYAYTTLKDVTIYGNYMLIVNNITFMFTSVFNGVTAGVGNLVAEGDEKKISSLFHELFSARFYLSTVFVFCLYRLADTFIVLWIGESFVLSKYTLIVILCIMYITMTRTTIDAFISAYGLYHDIYAPIIEASISLSLSVLLGHYYGITGILLGSLISLIVIVCIWKPYFVFKRAFRKSVWEYFAMYMKHIACFVLGFCISSFLLQYISIEISSFCDWILSAIITFIIFSLSMLIVMLIITFGMKLFIRRVKNIILKKIV